MRHSSVLQGEALLGVGFLIELLDIFCFLVLVGNEVIYTGYKLHIYMYIYIYSSLRTSKFGGERERERDRERNTESTRGPIKSSEA